MFEKFKHILGEDHLFYGIVVIVVSAASFGLGRLSVAPISPLPSENGAIVVSAVQAKAPVSSSTPVDIKPTTKESASAYVASKKGTKYHLPWCPGVSQIKEENKVYFASKTEAEKAGYTPASNCKGI